MAESLETGLGLMAAGMGTVLVLLAVLVLVVQGVSALSRWLAPPARIAATQPPLAETPPEDESELITVIGAAVAAYKRDTGAKAE
jgi:sodium pump decarboxylase gamma subunit